MTEQHDTSSDPRWPEPPVAGDEASTLLGALERQRATFAWKAGGLDAAGLRATTAASAITLGGLLKHLARVEDDYSSVRLFGREARPPFDRTGWSDDWSTAADNAPEQLYELWRDGVVRAWIRRGPRRWRPRPADCAPLARRSHLQSAAAPGRHDRGVRQARRPRRPGPRVDRRRGR
jgi:hypothetical protein